MLAVSRTAPESPTPGVTYVTGSVLDADVLERAVAGADVVFEALSPRGDMAGQVEGVFEARVALARQHGVRLGVLGALSPAPWIVGVGFTPQNGQCLRLSATFFCLGFQQLMMAPRDGPPIPCG